MNNVFPRSIHCIGIKGSGLAALAVLLKQDQCQISGSDTSDVFYTDDVLHNAGITWNTGFHPRNIPQNTELIIHSAAYTPENNEELAYTKKNAIPCLSYPEALGIFSRTRPSWAVIGTHGKTTTTGFIGLLCKSQNISAAVLTGTAFADFDNSAVLYQGDDVFFAEVCEYKNHFAHFSPEAAIFTSAEWEHPDYFHSADDVYRCFASFLKKLPHNALLIACADDAGVQNTLRQTKRVPQQTYLYTIASNTPKTFQNADTHVIRIHERGITRYEGKKVQSFTIQGLDPDADANVWYLPMPSVALVQNAVAAIISVAVYMKRHDSVVNWHAMQKALAQCKGVSRRSEVLYHDTCYTIMDDYAHHPTAIEKTLAGIAALYQPTRLRVNFMPHTHTRTEKLWNNFLSCFTHADEVIVNDVYASARETSKEKNRECTEETKDEHASYDAKHLAHAIKTKNNTLCVQYIPSIEQTIEYIHRSLQCGDLFLSMGAGDNFRTSHAIAQEIKHGGST